MENNLNVLIIDDDSELLDQLRARIDKTITVDGLVANVITKTLPIEMEKGQDNKFKISESTVTALKGMCSDKFDYIITDHAFVADRVRNKALREEHLANKTPVTKAELTEDFVLFHKHLKEAIENNSGMELVKENFLNYSSNIILYTYSPKPFADLYSRSALPDVKMELRKVFTHANDIDFLSLHDELCLDEKFSLENKPKPLITNLLAIHLNYAIDRKALLQMVRSQRLFRFKNFEIQNHWIVAYGIGLGAGVAVIGEACYHLVAHAYDLLFVFNEYKHAFYDFIMSVLVFIFSMLFLGLVSVQYAKFIENKLSKD